MSHHAHSLQVFVPVVVILIVLGSGLSLLGGTGGCGAGGNLSIGLLVALGEACQHMLELGKVLIPARRGHGKEDLLDLEVARRELLAEELGHGLGIKAVVLAAPSTQHELLATKLIADGKDKADAVAQGIQQSIVLTRYSWRARLTLGAAATITSAYACTWLRSKRTAGTTSARLR